MASLDQEWKRVVETKAALEALGLEPQVIAGALRQTQASERPFTRSDSESLTEVVERLDTLAQLLARTLGTKLPEQAQDSDPIPAGEAVDRWLRATKASGRKDSTISSYRKIASRLLKFVGDQAITSIDEEMMQAFLAHLRSRGSLRDGKSLSEAYIAKFIRTLRVFFKHCQDEGWIIDHPMDSIDNPKVGNKEPKAIEWEDFVQLMATTRNGSTYDRRDAAIMLVLHDVGLRVGEVCELKVSDLDLERNLIKRTNEEKVKTERPRPITAATCQALRTWLRVRPETGNEALFVSLRARHYGQPLQAGGIGQMLKRRAEENGVTGRVNPHSFRHARGRDHILSGGDTTTGAELLGHHSETTFSSFYARFGIGELQEKHTRHNSINTKFAYAELATGEEEETLAPPEFIAEVEIVNVPSQREVVRHFNRIFDTRRRVRIGELLNHDECDLEMVENLLDYCSLGERFGFRIVFPTEGLTSNPPPTIESRHLQISDIVIERKPTYH